MAKEQHKNMMNLKFHIPCLCSKAKSNTSQSAAPLYMRQSHVINDWWVVSHSKDKQFFSQVIIESVLK